MFARMRSVPLGMVRAVVDRPHRDLDPMSRDAAQRGRDADAHLGASPDPGRGTGLPQVLGRWSAEHAARPAPLCGTLLHPTQGGGPVTAHRTRRFGVASIATLALAAASVVPALAQSPSAAAPASSAGAGKTIAVITPDYATQPAAKEAIDRFQAAAEAQGYEVDGGRYQLATTPRSTARSPRRSPRASMPSSRRSARPRNSVRGSPPPARQASRCSASTRAASSRRTLVNVTTDNGFLGASYRTGDHRRARGPGHRWR